MTDAASKKLRLNVPVIGTHSGTFHADEALAVYLIKTLPQYSHAQLVRTRDAAVLERCDIAVDVGGVYDHATRRYDHHQRSFNETYSPSHQTRLSSAGLIYKHYGPEIVAEHLSVALNNPQVPTLVSKLYDDFVEAIDAIDNGINQYEAVTKDGHAALEGVEIRARYCSGTNLSSRIAHLNPDWNEPSTPEIFDAKFDAASTLAGTEFFSHLDYYAKSWLPARTLVVQALEERHVNDVGDPDGRVLVFERFCPWKEHLHTLESASVSPASQLPLYVLYPDTSSQWRIQAIPVAPNSFESRKPLPELWRGVRDNKLAKMSGVEGAIFCHVSGFIGGAQTKEGAIEMAKKALAA